MLDIVRVEVPVELAARGTFCGFSPTNIPEGETAVPRPTVPEKLFTLVKVIVELAELPGIMETVAGLEDILKSGITTMTGIIPVWVIPGAVALMVTV